MTDNPWDELDKSNKNKSTDDNGSVVDFLGLKRKKKTSQKVLDSTNISLGVEKNSLSKDESFYRNDDKSYNKNDNDFSNNLNQLFNTPLFPFKFKKNFQLFLSGIVVFLFFWLLSGFYTIRQEENAVVMRFGRYVRDATAGLHYHLPYPIENVAKEAITRVRVLKIGGDGYVNNRIDKDLGEGWALTGDENIVNLELNVQWKIDDLKKFIFKVRDREQTIYDATQSAIREVLSKRKLADILTSGRGEIEEETKKLLQEMLNSYDIGVNILVVQMLKIDPPSQVLDSFRDVQTARVDKESEINKAYKYKNDILPKVRGEAGKIREDANGYAIAVINNAKGDASRFNQIYEQYKTAPFITRKRMYLDTMEELFAKNKITIVDDNVKNVFLDNNTTTNHRKQIVAINENE